MNITNVRLTILTASKTLALASITISNDFVVSGLAIYNGQNGMWVSMPSRKNKEGTVNQDGTPKLYSDVAFPITREAREQIQSAVLDKYNELNEPNQAQREAYENVKAGQEKKNYQDSVEDDSSGLPF